MLQKISNLFTLGLREGGILPSFLDDFLFALVQEVIVQKNLIQQRHTECLITQAF